MPTQSALYFLSSDHLGSSSLTTDANGNMTFRVELSGSQRITYTQGWDYENRLTTFTNTATSPNVVSKFIYDGEGSRVLQVVISGTSIMTTAYAGALEVAISSTARITKTYYSAGSTRIAMRQVVVRGTAPHSRQLSRLSVFQVESKPPHIPAKRCRMRCAISR